MLPCTVGVLLPGSDVKQRKTCMWAHARLISYGFIEIIEDVKPFSRVDV